MERDTGRMPSIDGGRDWGSASTSQGLPEHKKLGERRATGSSLEPSEREWPC